MKRATLTLVAAAVVVAATAATSAPNRESKLPHLSADSPLTTRQAYEAENSRRREVVDSLLRTAQATAESKVSSRANSRTFAVELLGEYRAEEARDYLISSVSLRSRSIHFSDIAFADFAAVRALVRIGNSSVKRIIERLQGVPGLTIAEADEPNLHLFAYIIRQVDGDEVGLFRLQHAAKSATGTGKVNLLNLIDIYKLNESAFVARRKVIEATTVPAPPAAPAPAAPAANPQ